MGRRRKSRRGSGRTHGLLLIDKPRGPTSHDVVGWVRWALGVERVGHCGTLDPAATGLLVVCVGESTKLVEYLTAAQKCYRARFLLGVSTSTGDMQGDPVATIVDAETLAGAKKRAPGVLADMAGALSLPPPVYSAVRVDGVRAYELARRGEAPELGCRPMDIVSISSVGLGTSVERGVEMPWIEATILVSKGSYLRSIAVELGRRLGVPCCLYSLHRTASGDHRLSDSEAVLGLGAMVLPDRPGMESRAARWRIDFEGMGGDEQRKEVARARLDPKMVGVVDSVPFSKVMVDGDLDRSTLARLFQGQRISMDDRAASSLIARVPAGCDRFALVDDTADQLVIIRRDPAGEMHRARLSPDKILRYCASDLEENEQEARRPE